MFFAHFWMFFPCKLLTGPIKPHCGPTSARGPDSEPPWVRALLAGSVLTNISAVLSLCLCSDLPPNTHHSLLSGVVNVVSVFLLPGCLCPADSGVIVSCSMSGGGGGGVDAYTLTQTAHSSQHSRQKPWRQQPVTDNAPLSAFSSHKLKPADLSGWVHLQPLWSKLLLLVKLPRARY